MDLITVGYKFEVFVLDGKDVYSENVGSLFFNKYFSTILKIIENKELEFLDFGHLRFRFDNNNPSKVLISDKLNFYDGYGFYFDVVVDGKKVELFFGCELESEHLFFVMNNFIVDEKEFDDLLDGEPSISVS